jgi:hypothetical protein
VSPLTDALESHADVLTAAGAPVRRFLRPGLDDAQIRAAIGTIADDVHPDVVELYGWANGIDWSIDGDHTPDMFEVYWFLDLDTAVAEYGAGSAPAGQELESRWLNGWFPFLGGGSGQWVTVSNRPSEAGAVWFVDSPPWRLFDSLTDAIRAATAAVLTGRWVVNPPDGIITPA